MRLTINTAMPRVETSVSNGSAPRSRSGLNATRSTTMPARPASSAPASMATGKGRPNGSAARASRPLKPNGSPVSV